MGVHDVHVLLGQADDLLGRGDDVPVVGQQDDLVVGHRLDRGQHVLRAGVHRLTALDDRIDPKAAEDLDEPATGHDRDDADSVGPRRPGPRFATLRLEDAPVLCRHVADVELHELAVPSRQIDHACRVVRVHVHLDQLRLADDEH